jgi:hypothetical protein
MLQSVRLVPTETPISELRLARLGRRGALACRGRTPSNTRHTPRCTRLVRRSRPDTFHPPGRSWRKGEFDRKAGSPLPVSTRRVFVLSVLSVSANPNTARVESYQRVPWAKPDQPEPKLGTSGPIPPALV